MATNMNSEQEIETRIYNYFLKDINDQASALKQNRYAFVQHEINASVERRMRKRTRNSAHIESFRKQLEMVGFIAGLLFPYFLQRACAYMKAEATVLARENAFDVLNYGMAIPSRVPASLNVQRDVAEKIDYFIEENKFKTVMVTDRELAEYYQQVNMLVTAPVHIQRAMRVGDTRRAQAVRSAVIQLQRELETVAAEILHRHGAHPNPSATYDHPQIRV